MSDASHPRDALFEGERPPSALSPCDHYAGTEAVMHKALALQARREGDFDLTLDLEDGAPTGREQQHAELVVDLLRSEANAHGRVGVRIHDATSPHWRRDLDILVRGAGEQVAYITVPKAQSARQLARVIVALQNACALNGVHREIPLHVLLETHGALDEAFKIGTLPWVATLEFGIMDFVSAHHGAIDRSAMSSPGQFDHRLVARAKARQVAAALAHGLTPVHNVTLAVNDPDQVRRDATRARTEFGYLRMWSIHPSQIDPILESFAPDTTDVALAGRVLGAGQDAAWAPIRLDDTLYDRASYRYFWELLLRARAAHVALDDAIEARFFAEG